MHIQIICCKALKLLGFISRVSAAFHLLSPLKALFCSLVRPILEYGSILWDPSTASASSMIERVQRKFLRHAAYKLNIFCPPHDYSSIQCLFSLESLADLRHSANISFLSNLLSSKIDSPETLSRISFNVPSRRTRSSVPFHIPFSSSNYYFTHRLSVLCVLPILTLHSKLSLVSTKQITITYYIIFMYLKGSSRNVM